MTNTMSASFAESDFRVGRVISRSLSVLSRHFVTLFIIAAAAYLPTFLISLWMPNLVLPGRLEPAQVVQFAVYGILFLVVWIVFNVLSQAMIVHAAFQHMRRRPVHLVASVKVGLRRILSLLGLAIVLAIFVLLAFAGIIGVTALIAPFLLFLAPVPIVIILTVYFVTTPVCVVEERGPFASMGRSMQLTKGHRWKIFGLWLLLIVVLLIASILSGLLDVALMAAGGPVLAAIIDWVWNGVWVAYYAVTVAVAYHDLRVAKEGIDIEQIASVFD
jgi:hypothetical protein